MVWVEWDLVGWGWDTPGWATRAWEWVWATLEWDTLDTAGAADTTDTMDITDTTNTTDTTGIARATQDTKDIMLVIRSTSQVIEGFNFQTSTEGITAGMEDTHLVNPITEPEAMVDTEPEGIMDEEADGKSPATAKKTETETPTSRVFICH